jgi:tripartite-type tricarboxylate transporter receptor subunit TctC
MSIDRRTAVGLGAWALAAGAVPAIAWAQATPYPERTITMVVPFPPGGVADAVARPLAEALGRELKQSVVVENKGGAGGALGIGHAARAPADGYTLLLGLSSISVLPEADRILARKASYQLDQFKPIARLTADPTVLVVNADAPWKTLEEFVADVKRKPGAYTYGSSGNYGTMHVPMEMLKSAAGFSMTHIPYTGAGPAVTALLGGQVDALASGPASIASHVKAGKLRALAHWGETRLVSLPEVPSLRDQGVPV